MNWADELLKKKAKTKLMPSNETKTAMDMGYFSAKDDLTSAFLEKNKEIEVKTLVFVKQLDDLVIDEYNQIRLKGMYGRLLRDEAFRELVSKCEEVKK